MSEAPAPFFGAKWAVGLGGVFLLGFAAVTASAVYDKAHLSTLETITEPTAVGDTAFDNPAARTLGMPVVTWNGQPLRLADMNNISASDPDMRKAGMDDTHTYFIYTAPGKGDFYYIKARNTEYLKVQR